MMFRKLNQILVYFHKLWKSVLSFSLVYEISDEVVNATSGSDADEIVPWNDNSLWKFRVHASVNHLRQKLEGIDVAEGGW